jgi:catechol 2,3-dioxygenase-like lactoylglutathione lyase family enzyme
MAISIDRLDHLVLTVSDLAATCAFYEEVLGMTREVFAEGRLALRFGCQKINLHPHPSPYDPVAQAPAPGSADLCFIVDQPLDAVANHLAACGVVVELGPVARSGAAGPITSLYIRDPDGNLIELARYDDEGRVLR